MVNAAKSHAKTRSVTAKARASCSTGANQGNGSSGVSREDLALKPFVKMGEGRRLRPNLHVTTGSKPRGEWQHSCVLKQ